MIANLTELFADHAAAIAAGSPIPTTDNVHQFEAGITDIFDNFTDTREFHISGFYKTADGFVLNNFVMYRS